MLRKQYCIDIIRLISKYYFIWCNVKAANVCIEI